MIIALVRSKLIARNASCRGRQRIMINFMKFQANAIKDSSNCKYIFFTISKGNFKAAEVVDVGRNFHSLLRIDGACLRRSKQLTVYSRNIIPIVCLSRVKPA